MVLARVILFPVSSFMSLCSSATVLTQVVPIMLLIKNVLLSVSHLLNSLVGMGQAAMSKCCPVEYLLICVSVRYVRNI